MARLSSEEPKREGSSPDLSPKRPPSFLEESSSSG
jgi:hypothetical protein